MENVEANIQLGITDHLDPEVQAMLLAMYSRNAAPIATRIPDSEESNQSHKEKLGKFYVGYNHKSVGQLASTTIYLEGVSQLAAKAIENTPLFNGQECSTRYLPMDTCPMYAPEGPHRELIQGFQNEFRNLYIEAMPLTIDMLKEQFPFDSNQGMFNNKESVEQQTERKLVTWENTIKARAFDICRGLLPAGCTTNVGFVGTFDSINDHFGEMLHHPCAEMRDIAEKVLAQLAEKYQYAAIPIARQYITFAAAARRPEYFYDLVQKFHDTELEISSNTVWPLIQDQARERLKFEKFAKMQSDKIRFSFKTLLDFGSYRDMHRHRNGAISMPLLTTDVGFSKYYADQLPESIRDKLASLINRFEDMKAAIPFTQRVYIDWQYAIPMGYLVSFTYQCDLNQLLYILELRSGKTVHQTLRGCAQTLAKMLVSQFEGLKLHVDYDEDNFTLKRGTQTVSEQV